MIVAAIATFIIEYGTAVGLFYGLITLSLVGYSFVAGCVEIRQRARRPEPCAAEPEERPGTTCVAIAKLVLAICAAGLAAIAFDVAFEAAAPLLEKDRIVIGGLLVPLLWAGGIAWMMADLQIHARGIGVGGHCRRSVDRNWENAAVLQKHDSLPCGFERDLVLHYWTCDVIDRGSRSIGIGFEWRFTTYRQFTTWQRHIPIDSVIGKRSSRGGRARPLRVPRGTLDTFAN